MVTSLSACRRYADTYGGGGADTRRGPIQTLSPLLMPTWYLCRPTQLLCSALPEISCSTIIRTQNRLGAELGGRPLCLLANECMLRGLYHYLVVLSAHCSFCCIWLPCPLLTLSCSSVTSTVFHVKPVAFTHCHIMPCFQRHTYAGPALEGVKRFQSKAGDSACALPDRLGAQQVQCDGHRLSLGLDGIQAPEIDLHA